MSSMNDLLNFESKYPFLYDFEANGFPICDGLRDHLVSLFSNNTADSMPPLNLFKRVAFILFG